MVIALPFESPVDVHIVLAFFQTRVQHGRGHAA